MAGDQNKFRTAMFHAERFSEEGDWNQANTAYRYALAEFPNNEAAIVGFGVATYQLGSAENAWRAFQQALKINPNNTDALSCMADIQVEMGRPETAAQTYLRAGNILASKGDIAAGVEAWQQAIEIKSDFVDAHRNLAHGLARQGEERLAARQFLALAALYQQQRNIPMAAQQVEAARQLIPDDSGIETAISALKQGQLVQSDMISETEPEPEPASFEPDMFDFEEETIEVIPSLMLPEEDEDEDVTLSVPSSLLMEPDEKEDDFSAGIPSLLTPEDDEPEDDEFSDLMPSLLTPEEDEPEEDEFSDLMPSLLTPEEDEPEDDEFSDLMPSLLTPEDDEPEEDDFSSLMPSLLLPEDDEPEDDFSSLMPSLLLPEDDEPEVDASSVMPTDETVEPTESEEDDPFAEDALGDFFDDTPAEEEVEEDPFDFSFDSPDSNESSGGLIESKRQKALAELANIIFEDDQGGPETSVLPDGTQVSRMEINMMVIQAIDLQARGDMSEAVDKYRQVVQANAGRPALYYNLGLLYQEQEEYTESVKLLRMASPDPDYRLSVQFALGQAYYASDKPEQTLMQFSEVLKEVDLETVDDEQYDELESFYDSFADEFLADETPDKLENFVTAVKQFFSHDNWLQRVDEARQRLDRISDDRVMSLAEFLESPETEMIITALANTNEYLELDLPMSASEECLRAIQRAPLYLPLHTRLADILLRQNKTDAAINKYVSVANVYEIRHQTEQAVGVFKKILKISPLDTTIRTKLIDMNLRRDKIDPAMEHSLALADSYYQLAQEDKALKQYEDALRLAAKANDPSHWQVKILNQTGDIYNQRFDWNKATAYFEQSHQLDPKNERASKQLVDLYYKQGRTSQAIKVLDKLLAVYHKDEPIKAIKLLKELVTINSGDMFLQQRLAISYMQGGNKQDAISAYDELGEMQLNKNMNAQAAQTIQTILRLKPENPDGYKQLLQQIKAGTI
ncbi:tetratricopeptide repeat protein [Anaerolineales bacterium HSG6]|nr:tetratricopeptide repeat protein [Anaerolineales bacterium HSG6]